MKSPGELMEKRRKTHQHGLQHGEIRCEHTHIYSIYIISEPMTGNLHEWVAFPR